MQISFQSEGEKLVGTLHGDLSGVGVVLCPPHLLYGGSRNDTRIVRAAKELASNNISALCIDYGRYGKGVKEVLNVLDAIRFMRKRVSSLGLLGYSFGAVVAANAAIQAEIDGFVAMSILKRVNGLETNLDFGCSKFFVHGKHDNVAPYSEFEDLYAVAKEPKKKLVLDTDHFYMDEYPALITLASKNIRSFFEEAFSQNGIL